ncbi:MAG: urea ABC transporter permease subunit UrtC [Burkholderiales bacterium]|nr:urea ABC transporter permease subunit UrtC [Burkholderiales bacterium]
MLTAPRRSLFTPVQWVILGLAFIFVGVAVPLAHAWLPTEHALRPSTYTMTLSGKFMCYAMVAVAMDLIWGFTGILSLGQSLFFALGGYAFGMYLMRGIGREGQYQSELPDFMVFLDWKTLPWTWWNSDSFLWTMFLVVAVPGALAFVFGFFAFRSRIKGVYFSIITQALTFAFMLLFFRNETGFGGNNGFTDFKTILGFRITDPSTKAALLSATAVGLFGTFVLARWLVTRKFGRVLQAIRDAESRARFCGYDTLGYKLGIWTLAAVISGVAGALYVPQVGIINPSEMSPANSIEVAIWTAVGGRGTLIGPIIGAFLVNGAKSWFTQAFPEYWLFFLGLLFVLVTLFLPRGVIALFDRIRPAAKADADEAPQAAAAPARAAAGSAEGRA